MFTIATWNVNSLRTRLSHLLDWLNIAKPDVLALQETKLLDIDFPVMEITQAGYQMVFCGQKAYNGVALLSRFPISDTITCIPGFDDHQRRLLAATVNKIRVINLYVPNGSEVGSEKYLYKLNWLAKITDFIKQQQTQYERVVVLGDFNIAPEDRDVHDPKRWEGSVLVSAAERDALKALMAIGLQDAFRLFEQGEGHFSWWDYRAGAFVRGHGLRIDHILLSTALAKECKQCLIDKSPRSWERPSDHVPVVASLGCM